MSPLEEIENLKGKLATTGSNTPAEGEVLLELLNKYAYNNSIECSPYIERLMELAEIIAAENIRYRAFGLYYLGNLKRLKGGYDECQNLTEQALKLFEQIGDEKSIANCYHNIGGMQQSQSNYADAMRNYLHALKIREKINDLPGIGSSYNNIGNIHEHQGNFNESLKYYSLALEIREKIGEKRGIATCYFNMGKINQNHGNYAEGLKNYFHCLEIMREIGDKQGVASSHNNIGNIYELQGNYPEAMNNYLPSLRIRQERGDKEGIAESYNNIAVIQYHQRNYTEALKNILKVLQLMTELGYKKGMAHTLNNVGQLNEHLDNYPEALKNYLSSLQISEDIKDKKGIADANYHLGIALAHQGNYRDALQHQLRAVDIYEETNQKKGVANALQNIADIYYKQGDYSDALREALISLEIEEKIGEKRGIKSCCYTLFEISKATGDFESALKYHEKYHQVESEILGEQAQKQITSLNFQHNLEQKEKDLEIEQLRNVELKKEKDRSDSLLLNILPAEVAEELKEKGTADAKHFDNVTVLFTDFKSFTTVSERLTPQQLVDELHTCFSAFDEICGKYNIEKIKTVGDAYLAVSGLPLANPNHAEEMIKAAIEIRDFMLTRKRLVAVKAPFGGLGADTFEVRIGIHSGSVVAGIVGVKKFAYDIWGDTVNTAARMEQNSEAGKINISQSTYELVKDKFKCEYRGEIEAKNKGKLKMYFLN
jgi:adenylate cyclase